MVSNFNSFAEDIKDLKTDEEIIEYAKKRLDILEEESEVTSINAGDTMNFKGFTYEGYINSDTGVGVSALTPPFYINELSLYTDFIKQIQNVKMNHPLLMFYELQRYLNNKFGPSGNQFVRESIYIKKYDADESVSIGDFYDVNAALCGERSAAVQNILSFCGIKSYFMGGKLLAENKTEEHAFNILKFSDGTLMLYDPTNPFYNKTNNSCIPAYYVIGKYDIEELKDINFSLDTIKLIHPNDDIDEGKQRTYLTRNYLLSSPTL